jgi:Bacterial PH domain
VIVAGAPTDTTPPFVIRVSRDELRRLFFFSLIIGSLGLHNLSSHQSHSERLFGIVILSASAAMVAVVVLRCFFPRTVFTDTGIEYRTLFRGTQHVTYTEIERVKLGGSSFYHAVHIFTIDGRQLNITGTLDQVTRGEQIVRERIPQNNALDLR